MSRLSKLVAFGGPLLLVLLTVIAGYAYSQNRFLSLPIPEALGLFTIVLPLITGLSIQGAHSVIRRSSKRHPPRLTLPLLAIIGFQLIYDTVIATLALTHILPPSALQCDLNTQWQKLYTGKDEKAIRAVQDSFQCCGLNSVKDRAWPFVQQKPSPCAAVFGRDKSCLGDWRKAEQVGAGLFLLVAIVVFVMKVLSMISLLTGSPWNRATWTSPSHRTAIGDDADTQQDDRATTRRLIEEGDDGEEYHDEPTGLAIEGPNGDAQNQSPRVEPSQLINTNNEWRDS